MTTAARMSIEQILARTGALAEAQAPADDPAAEPAAVARELLAMGEDVLIAWNEARGAVPTDKQSEGFRLLALHRQGARGEPNFNACRETCREIVYHHNLILHDPAAADAPRHARIGAMVVRHLALFVGGKLEEAGLGEFCCSSRPLRQTEQTHATVDTYGGHMMTEA